MLKRPITYTDFNDQKVTDIFYFNLTKAELVDLEVKGGPAGLGETIKRIIETKEHAKLLDEFKALILRSYGVKSEDGKRFIKTPELAAEFEQTAAYSELFMELATQDNAAADFIVGILPADMRQGLEAEIKKAPTSQLPPPPVPA